MARQPSPNWSRGFAITSTSYAREIVADNLKEGGIIILSAIKDGNESLRITKLGRDMQDKVEYDANIDKLNINRINLGDIQLVEKRLFWIDNKEGALYTSVLDDINKKFGEVDRLRGNVVDFDVTEDNRYLVVTSSDGKLGFYEEINGEYVELVGPSDLINVKMVNIKSNNNIIYLQTAILNKDNSYKEVYITEYRDNKWGNSIYMTSLLEVKSQIKDMQFASDKDYVYSISSVQGDDRTTYTYIINGYSKETKELFNEIKTRWAIELKVQEFSSKPIMLDSDNNGVTVFTTAPSILDIRATNSNVIKLNLTKDGFTSAELVSNTKKWSNQVIVLRDKNTDYVLWNESAGFGSTVIMGTSNDEAVLEKNAGVTMEDIKGAIAEEAPYFVNLLIVLVGARLFNTFPAIIWLLCMFMWYSVMEKNYNRYLYIGILIHLIFQITSMDFYYKNSHIMPEFLILSLAKYVIPLLFAVLAIGFAFAYKKEADEPQSYKVYAMYLVYYHILINYLYVPYLF